MNALKMKSMIPTLVLMVFSLLLVACEPVEQAELKTWMDQQRKQTPTSIKKLVPPAVFQPAPYTMSGELEPFDGQKLKSALAKARVAAGSNTKQPDQKRRREPLEAYPLESMKMVGYLFKGKPFALVQVNGALHNVSVGQYLGTDYGRVIALTESEITLKEAVQDATGDWSERISKLTIQDAAKEGKK